jgi:hypothetical protein
VAGFIGQSAPYILSAHIPPNARSLHHLFGVTVRIGSSQVKMLGRASSSTIIFMVSVPAECTRGADISHL